MAWLSAEGLAFQRGLIELSVYMAGTLNGQILGVNSGRILILTVLEVDRKQAYTWPRARPAPAEPGRAMGVPRRAHPCR